MKNKVKRRETFEYTTLQYEEQSIQALEDILTYLKSFKATHFDLYANRDWGSNVIESIEFTPLKITYETDRERALREEVEQKIAALEKEEALKVKEQYERDLLKQLKEKYENG